MARDMDHFARLLAFITRLHDLLLQGGGFGWIDNRELEGTIALDLGLSRNSVVCGVGLGRS